MKRQMAVYMLILAVAPFHLLCVPPLAHAQSQPAIRIAVQAGYDGAYRVAEWFPVVVSLANTGADVQGVLEWSFPGQLDEQTVQRTIELPQGSQKRVTLAVLARSFARNGRLTLLENGAPLSSQDVRLEPLDAGAFLIGVVSSDPALLNSLSTHPIAGTSSTMVRHFDLATLPEQAAALRGLNALFVHDIDSSMLSAAQRAALALWVRLGGQLVVSGGMNGQPATTGLAGLLPIDVTGGITSGDLTPLATFAGANVSPQPATAALSTVQPRPGAESLPADRALLYRWRYGAGWVTFSAFDLASLRGWIAEPVLWGKLLDPTSLLAPGTSARLHQSNLLQQVLQLRGVALPSIGVLLGFLLIYVLIMGPLNYLALRRLRRLDWAWLTIPAVVFVFAAGLYVVGVALRGDQLQLNQLEVVQGVEGQPGGFSTAFVELFSPYRATYSLMFPIDTLVSELPGFVGAAIQPAPTRNGDTDVEVPDVLFDVGAVRTFVAEAAVNVPLRVQSALRNNGGMVQGEIRNTGSNSLDEVLIVRGSSFEQLGTLPSGTSKTVMLDTTARDFPQGTNLPNTGQFNRQELLNVLFTSNLIVAGKTNSFSIDPRDVYLLAWGSQPSLPVQVNGQRLAQRGITLYIIRLRS